MTNLEWYSGYLPGGFSGGSKEFLGLGGDGRQGVCSGVYILLKHNQNTQFTYDHTQNIMS